MGIKRQLAIKNEVYFDPSQKILNLPFGGI